MKYDNDINTIRHLLDKYYRAETSPDEEERIGTFFSEMDHAYIPEDMVADARLFSLMKETHTLPSECEVPDDLIDKLNGIVETPIPSTTYSEWRRIFKIFKYSGIAVAACAAWAIIMFKPFEQHTETNPILNNQPDMIHDKRTAEIKENEESVLTIVKSQSDKYAFAEKQIGEMTETEQSPAEASDGFIEITDPEEARKIAMSIGNLLAQNAGKTNDAMMQIENSIDSYKEITKSILQ